MANLKDFMKQQINPKDFLLNLMQQNHQNPMIVNLIKAAQQGNYEQVENFVRNICKEQGRDFDKEFGEFKNQINR